MSQDRQICHLGALSIVVSDLDRSSRFYEALGFVAGETGERGDKSAKYMELPSCKYLVRYMRRPDVRMELVEFQSPAPIGDRQRAPTNRLGPSTTSYVCDDPDAMAAQLEQLGGTRILADKFGNGRYNGVIMTDLDGNRLLLVSATLDEIKTLFGG
jgi:catechol 2,3-dioxygenase-like lactoylglutathione lyase family enzyme